MLNVRLFLVGLAGFFWGGFITPFSIKLARSYKIMDHPSARKIHAVQMPRGAGLGLWAGYLLWALSIVELAPEVRWSATGATLVFFCGYLDDMQSQSPFLRLAAHFLAASLVVFPMQLPPLTAFTCLAWLTGVTSAYNLIDGVNGLCTSLFIASSLALVFWGTSLEGAMMACMALGVLCWNFPAAQTFLGDGGSTLLGFLFASNFIRITARLLVRLQIHELILLLLLFGGVPVLDTLIAFSRRILEGNSPFYPDKKHFHHLLTRLTNSPSWTVLCLLSLQVLFLIGGLTVCFRLS
ncbi:MAG: undecaprenyl/decaprenyl-phosphate alpha-N-acetylglucosaminyl 1-phosphate transferase [Fretibacterium sp.]|nr:undecaprenyl/decaprenyl-phosphate alpha-N-acetylglucosaminyl 1-phosphate transferase [Fretibacterium sp.]